MFKTYYALIKPGIIYGNLITAAAGFFLASAGSINFWLITGTLLGTSLVIASACVFNNWYDRDLDALMARTRNRALVKGTISTRAALTFATVLGVVGFAILIQFVNLTTTLVGVVGFVDYAFFYGFSKRTSVFGTLIGSVAGATPIVAGYTAVTSRIDLGAIVLFAILVAWQMPHFYSIAIYRLKDYTNAHLPVLPVRNGVFVTKVVMSLFIVSFAVAAGSLSFFGYAGYTYLVAVVILSLVWLALCLSGFRAANNTAWAGKMFRFSLLLLTTLSIMMAVDTVQGR